MTGEPGQAWNTRCPSTKAAAKYPNLAALGPIVVEHAGMSTFESGLTLLLDTFERLAP
jgi:hypothetical protein